MDKEKKMWPLSLPGMQENFVRLAGKFRLVLQIEIYPLVKAKRVIMVMKGFYNKGAKVFIIF